MCPYLSANYVSDCPPNMAQVSVWPDNLHSGKDCTKVDRSAAYAARYVAKNIVAARLAKKCEIQLSYAIGVSQPTSVMVDTFGTGILSDSYLVEIIRENFDLTPAGIIKMLDLRRPIYKQTAAYGHFGRNDLELPWEKLDKVDELIDCVKKRQDKTTNNFALSHN